MDRAAGADLSPERSLEKPQPGFVASWIQLLCHNLE